MTDESPHADKRRRDLEKGAEEMGDSMRDGVKGFHLGKRRTIGAASARDADDKMTRPTTADTLVAHEEKDLPLVLDAIYYPEENAGVAAELGVAMGDTADMTASRPPLETQEHKIRSSVLSCLPPQNQEACSGRITQTPGTPLNLNLDTDYPVHICDNYDSGNVNKADNEILEVPREREGRLGMSTNELSHTFAFQIL